MRPQDSYRCLACGSLSGEPSSENSQNWYWKLWPHGKTGPYCCQDHAMSWPAVADATAPQFSLAEAMRLLEVSHRINQAAS